MAQEGTPPAGSRYAVMASWLASYAKKVVIESNTFKESIFKEKQYKTPTKLKLKPPEIT